jgi:hypothetical protein
MKLLQMNTLFIADMDGQVKVYHASIKKSTKWSILPLYTYDGFVDWKIIHGSFNGDSFIEFIEDHVIPHTNPYPGPRSVLIMDNAKIHHDEVCSYY